ncbi:chemotaxis protein CheW [Massilia sp. 2TAF26]|uniref:chemotaxis protein CheW n=1 Tax=Massilia sp. 2TAF26 TaxID=3233012 RepID=UPI003F9AAAA7
MKRLRDPRATPSRPGAAGALIDVLEFECQGGRFALPLDSVRRVIMSAQPTPLPGASDVVIGLLNVAGQTVTVLDLARRAGYRPTVLDPEQYFLLVEIASFPCAVVAERIVGIARHDASARQWPPGAGGAAFVDGAVQLDDGLCLVIDPHRFLFEQDIIQLAAALAEHAHD